VFAANLELHGKPTDISQVSSKKTTKKRTVKYNLSKAEYHEEGDVIRKDGRSSQNIEIYKAMRGLLATKHQLLNTLIGSLTKLQKQSNHLRSLSSEQLQYLTTQVSDCQSMLTQALDRKNMRQHQGEGDKNMSKVKPQTRMELLAKRKRYHDNQKSRLSSDTPTEYQDDPSIMKRVSLEFDPLN
jgi:hypothetical protein